MYSPSEICLNIATHTDDFDPYVFNVVTDQQHVLQGLVLITGGHLFFHRL